MGIKCTINQSVREVVWAAADGREITLHADRLSDETRAYAMLHGIKQRGNDVMALGKGATDGAKLEELEAIVKHLESGSKEWSRRQGGGGRISANRGLLLIALARLAPGKEAKQAEAVEGFTNDEIAAILMRPDVKRIADQVLAERSVGVDADALLADLI